MIKITAAVLSICILLFGSFSVVIADDTAIHETSESLYEDEMTDDALAPEGEAHQGEFEPYDKYMDDQEDVNLEDEEPEGEHEFSDVTDQGR